MKTIDSSNSIQWSIDGLSGHWHRSLNLPDGYQHFNWYVEGENPNGVILNDIESLLRILADHRRKSDDLYLYTQHEITYQDGVIKQTRSSPNWEGGLVTYSTCKHFMRTTDRKWAGTWLAGLCPSSCENNCLLFAGQIRSVFRGNYHLREHLLEYYPEILSVKEANTNPRGDIYTPAKLITSQAQEYHHQNFITPEQHTRSVECYNKSPGSRSNRSDGKIPKFWRDLEYVGRRGLRPPSFILSPVWLFSRPLVWSSKQPKRAVLRMNATEFGSTLHTR